MAQCESLRFKLLGGLAVRRAAYGVVRFIMENGAKACEVIISGKLRAQRAKAMKFKDGYLISTGGGSSLILGPKSMMPLKVNNTEATRWRADKCLVPAIFWYFKDLKWMPNMQCTYVELALDMHACDIKIASQKMAPKSAEELGLCLRGLISRFNVLCTAPMLPAVHVERLDFMTGLGILTTAGVNMRPVFRCGDYVERSLLTRVDEWSAGPGSISKDRGNSGQWKFPIPEANLPAMVYIPRYDAHYNVSLENPETGAEMIVALPKGKAKAKVSFLEELRLWPRAFLCLVVRLAHDPEGKMIMPDCITIHEPQEEVAPMAAPAYDGEGYTGASLPVDLKDHISETSASLRIRIPLCPPPWSLGAGRFWGDEGDAEKASDWSRGWAASSSSWSRPHHSESPSGTDFAWSKATGQSEIAIPCEEGPSRDPEAVPTFRVDPIAAQRIVRFHIASRGAEREEASPSRKAATETESLWAKWAPGAVQIEDRGSYQPGGYSHSEQLHGSSAFAVAPRSDKATGPRVRLCKELAESWSTRDILRVTDCHLEEFDATKLRLKSFDLWLLGTGMSAHELSSIPESLRSLGSAIHGGQDQRNPSSSSKKAKEEEEQTDEWGELDADCYFPPVSGTGQKSVVGVVVAAPGLPEEQEAQMKDIRKQPAYNDDEAEVLRALEHAEEYEELEDDDYGDIIPDGLLDPDAVLWGPTALESRDIPDMAVFKEHRAMLAAMKAGGNDDDDDDDDSLDDGMDEFDENEEGGKVARSSRAKSTVAFAEKEEEGDFENLMAEEYTVDDIGGCDEEIVEGHMDIEDLEDILDEYLQDQEDERQECYSIFEPKAGRVCKDDGVRVIPETMALIAKQGYDVVNEDIEESEGEDRTWDCDTVLSTLSNVSNRPGKIGRIKAIKKPPTLKPMKEENGAEEDEESEEEAENVTPEDKKIRKNSKESKEMYKNEAARLPGGHFAKMKIIKF
ncbi:unnamed protein product [Polarella glacialis]|uniref:40S ribosomal protein S3 n=1 Tax=Polarella glacialis TaxID=89957 RepID=A0A813JPP9_POLGL|nr:unnamed protein product [Polarella glacialis]